MKELGFGIKDVGVLETKVVNQTYSSKRKNLP